MPDGLLPKGVRSRNLAAPWRATIVTGIHLVQFNQCKQASKESGIANHMLYTPNANASDDE